MLSRDLLKAVKHLEILARRAVNDQLAGQYHSVFKGRGMDFVDVRAYQPGDDIRFIDWNVSARLDELHIKRFVEERELTVFLLVDVSGSQLFGTQARRKQEAAAELASLIAFSAVQNNDRVGLIIFSDRIECFIPPKKGKKHVLRVITEILTCEPVGKRTHIAGALEYLTRINRKKSVAFIISDFQDQAFSKALDIAQRRHELVPVVITDPMEENLPAMGIVQMEDPETGVRVAIDTSSKKVRDAFAAFAVQQRQQREQAFQRLKIDSVQVRTDADHIRPLINYFRQRARRH
jgi:uncharacterized protein (DUF58 family)